MKASQIYMIAYSEAFHVGDGEREKFIIRRMDELEQIYADLKSVMQDEAEAEATCQNKLMELGRKRRVLQEACPHFELIPNTRVCCACAKDGPK